jgi:hypothetical protein
VTIFGSTIWILLALVGMGAVLAMLHSMASAVQFHVQIHETRLKVARLRSKYAADENARQYGEPQGHEAAGASALPQIARAA